MVLGSKNIRDFFKGKVDKTFFKDNKEILDKTNYGAIVAMYITTAIFESLLYIFVGNDDILGLFRYSFLIMAIFSLVGSIVILTVVKKHLKFVKLAYYLISIALFADTIIMGVFYQPDMPAVTFFAILIIVTVIFIDRPINSIIIAIIASAVFDSLVVLKKSAYPRTMAVDITNSIIVLGGVIVFICYLRNLHLSNLQAKLKFKLKSELDALTGTYNKVHTENLCENYLASQLQVENCGLLILDLDNFKTINDTYGHRRGDEVLRLVGEALQRLFSEEDIVGRIGGDEFVVFIKNRETDIIVQLANDLLIEIRSIANAIDIDNVSCSAGICINKSKGIAYQEMFLRADKMLYEAKRGGKDTAAYYCKSIQ